jgi:hypothetical protein
LIVGKHYFDYACHSGESLSVPAAGILTLLFSQIFLVLATALAQGGFESANNANADDWYTQRVEAEQNGCTNTRAAHVWTEFHLGIPASSDAEFESNIPALKEAAASAINLHCSDVASHCPATLVADDLCVLPEMVTRRRLNSVSVTGIRAIFVVGVNTIKQATSIKKYVLSEQFKDDMLASMITANVQTSQDITVLTVYKESIQVNASLCGFLALFAAAFAIDLAV